MTLKNGGDIVLSSEEVRDKVIKKTIVGVIVLFVFLALAPAYAAGLSKLVDNFENNLDLKNPEWWVFDRVTRTVVKNPPARPGDSLAKSCGKYSLNIKGSAKDWYCGGIGTYVGLDASSFTGLEMCIWGNGAGSGKLKIELYDDDKGSWETKYDKNWVPLKDDIWSTEQNVDWRGWKKVYIPFSNFVLTNPKRGDGKRNFNQLNGSGGLLQIQMVVLANSADGETNMNIDNVKLISMIDDEE